LERYAASALGPDKAQLSRMRDNVVLAYLGRNTRGAGEIRPSRPWARRWSFVLALVLLLLGSGVVAAESGPGQPFYQLRLTIASFTVPSQGAARERGLAAQLDDRLNEADAALRNGDGRAAEAAIQAYLHTLDELERDGTLEPAVLADLQHHLDVLRALMSTAPPQATNGLQQAIDEAKHASGETQTGKPSGGSHPSPAPHASDPATHKP
ncbi:MAG: hypothetical protein M3O78_02350, partial [Chloroflexota bacterium]|nr:hypothetical protein [Chloroflexota bacterium]